MKWLINCLRCRYSWYIETQHMEKGLPPAQSLKCPNCYDDTLTNKKYELLKDSPQKQGMDRTNTSTSRTDSPNMVMDFLRNLFAKKQPATSSNSQPSRNVQHETMKTIKEVHVYMTDISPDRFISYPNSEVSVAIPKALFPQADEMCHLNGTLVKYFSQHSVTKSHWVSSMSMQEWRSFIAKEFPSRDLRVCQLQTADIAYTIVVVMSKE